MKDVFVHHDPTVTGMHKSRLEQAGIECYIRNENTSAMLGAGIFGAVQSPIFDPVLCIVDDARFEEAMAILNDGAAEPPEPESDWTCPQCGETVPGNFETCWKCSSPPPPRA